MFTWGQYGPLPTGKGGKPKTLRKPAVKHAQPDTQLFRDVTRPCARRWQPCDEFVPPPLSSHAIFALILFCNTPTLGGPWIMLKLGWHFAPCICVDLAIDPHSRNALNRSRRMGSLPTQPQGGDPIPEHRPHGGRWTLEHPRGPAAPELQWSIWFSGLATEIRAVCDAGLLTMLQGPREPFPKPTCWLYGRLDRLPLKMFSFPIDQIRQLWVK